MSPYALKTYNLSFNIKKTLLNQFSCFSSSVFLSLTDLTFHLKLVSLDKNMAKGKKNSMKKRSEETHQNGSGGKRINTSKVDNEEPIAKRLKESKWYPGKFVLLKHSQGNSQNSKESSSKSHKKNTSSSEESSNEETESKTNEDDSNNSQNIQSN
ncbi:CLUMA_CG014474, isoform A, partial [Clunio marinus]